MKKWLGMASSAVAGVLGLVFLALSAFSMKFGGLSETINGYDLIKESADIKGYTLYKIATIALIVVAALLIVWAIVLLLNNLNVLKVKFNLNIINVVALAVFAVLAIVSLIALFVMGGDVPSPVTGSPAVGAWLNLVVAVLACVGGILPLVLKSKK